MYKYFFLILITVCLFESAHAESQINRGSYIISGSVSYSKLDYDFDFSDGGSDNGYSKSISISPGVLYFVGPKLGIGARLGLTKSSSDNSDSKSYRFSPAIRYYFILGDSNPFVEFSYGMGRNKREFAFSSTTTTTTTTTTQTTDINTAALEFGLNYFIARNVAFEPSVIYTREKQESEVSEASSSLDVDSTNLTLGIGITVFIN